MILFYHETFTFCSCYFYSIWNVKHWKFHLRACLLNHGCTEGLPRVATVSFSHCKILLSAHIFIHLIWNHLVNFDIHKTLYENNKRSMGFNALLIWWPLTKGLVVMHVWCTQEAANLSSKHYWQRAKCLQFNLYKNIEIWSTKARNEVTLTWYWKGSRIWQ